MNALLTKLNNYGADISGAMARFVGDEELYEECFDSLISDDNFPLLGEAIQKSDYKLAFEHAHALKGIIGNMGLTPLYEIVCRVVESLRKCDYDNLQNDYLAIMSQLDSLVSFRK